MRAHLKNDHPRGLRLKTKQALLLIALGCQILFQGWIDPGQARAAVSVLDPWPATPQINNVAASPSTTSFAPSAGSNRIVLISVHDHTNNATATTITVAYGSNNIPARPIVNSPNNQRRQVWLFYLNEADIAAASGTTVTVTSSNVGSGMSAYLATLGGVDQANTVVPTPYAVYSPTVSYSFNVAAGGYAMFASTDNSAADPTNNEGYVGSASRAVGAAYSYIAAKIFASAATTGPTYTTDATFSAFAAAAFNPAAASGDLTIGNGTDPATAGAQQGAANQAIDGFTAAMSAGSGSISAVTLTTNAQFTAANVAGIKLYRDAGTIGSFDGADTPVPVTYSIGAGTATITITTPENVTTTAANYLITVDIAPGATLGSTLSARVTGATGAIGTPVYSDSSSATLTVSAPVCTRADPTVALAPASQTVGPGGSISYTVQVTNNDSSACSPTTFTLSKTDLPATPNANFGASAIQASIGPLSGGSFQTATLTVTATAGAANGSSMATSVTAAADANHGAVTSGTVSSTVGIIPAGPPQASPAGNPYLYAALALGMVFFGVMKSRKRTKNRSA